MTLREQHDLLPHESLRPTQWIPIAAAALAILALATLATACGQDAPSSPTPATAPVVISAPTPVHSPLPAPPPAPASDAYFSLGRILDIEIEIAAEDWDTLRHQTRTFEDLMEEIEKYGLSRPFASIYTWFSGAVTVDGETHSNVGVRKKGFIGSQSDTKPSLKLRFDKYVARLKDLLDNVWDEDELLASVDRMAAIVQAHSLPEARAEAAEDTGRVRKFILKRRDEILADLTPEPPEWPEPEETAKAGESGSLEVTFETTWASNRSSDPFEEGKVTRLLLNEDEEPADDVTAISGHASPDEQLMLPGAGELASLAIFGVEPDGSVSGLTIVLPLSQLTPGATLDIGDDEIAGGVWTIPAGSATPDSFTPFTVGTLDLSEAGTQPDAVIAGSFSGAFGTTASDTGN